MSRGASMAVLALAVLTIAAIGVPWMLPGDPLAISDIVS